MSGSRPRERDRDPAPEIGRLRPATPADAEAIASWRYRPPFDLYDGDGDPDAIPLPDSAGMGYYVVEDAAGVLAFLCVGPEGRVLGQQDEPGTLDMGMGVRPDALSRGVGSSLLALVTPLASRLGAHRVRVAVAAFNSRSLHLCASAGLVENRRFAGPQGREFVELVGVVPAAPNATTLRPPD